MANNLHFKNQIYDEERVLGEKQIQFPRICKELTTVMVKRYLRTLKSYLQLTEWSWYSIEITCYSGKVRKMFASLSNR